MRFVIRRRIHLFMVLAATVCSFPAQAGYDFTIIDAPNSGFTEVFGINNSGQVTVTGFDAFVYDLKKGTFTELPSVSGAFTAPSGINESGVVVGIATDEVTFNDSAFILDKNGIFALFSYPGLDNTEARAIGNSGQVTGYAFQNDFSDFTGFIYDPKHDTFVDIRIPNSVFITAQGINNRGEVVGSVNLNTGGACTGCPAGQYGYLRSNRGIITFFQVNSISNRTRARGITDSGWITGDVRDNSGNGAQGFVASVAADGGFHLLQISTADLVNVPGAVETTPEAIDNSGRIVGITVDVDGNLHGFVATPTRK